MAGWGKKEEDGTWGRKRSATETHTHIDLKRIGSVGPEVSMQHWSKEDLEKDSNRQKKSTELQKNTGNKNK